MSTEIKASEFKAKCLALLDEVAQTRQEIIVTKHGRPLAKLVPLQDAQSLEGSVTINVDDDELLYSTGEVWDLDGDPADRILVATALGSSIPLVSKDRNIRSWALSRRLDCIW